MTSGLQGWLGLLLAVHKRWLFITARQPSVGVSACNQQGYTIVCYRGHLGLLQATHRVLLLCVTGVTWGYCKQPTGSCCCVLQGSLGVTANNPQGLAIVCYRVHLGLFQITHQVWLFITGGPPILLRGGVGLVLQVTQPIPLACCMF